MPRWTNYAKIHEGCGGHVRWVEAIDTPGVGFHGECLRCSRGSLPREDIIPIACLAPHEATGYKPETLRVIEWDDDADWETNQRQIAETLGEQIEGHNDA